MASSPESASTWNSWEALPPMEPGAMCYMLSKDGYAGDGLPHWPPHVMFFYSDTDPASWGANVPSSPVLAVADPVEHLTSFAIAAQQWSDGTEYRPPDQRPPLAGQSPPR